MRHDGWIMRHGGWIMRHGGWIMRHGGWIMSHGGWIMSHESYRTFPPFYQHVYCASHVVNEAPTNTERTIVRRRWDGCMSASKKRHCNDDIISTPQKKKNRGKKASLGILTKRLLWRRHLFECHQCCMCSHASNDTRRQAL